MSTLNISQVAKELIAHLEPHIVQHSFVLNKNTRCFTRTMDGIVQKFELRLFKDADVVLVEPVVRIKLAQIENIYHHTCTKDAKYFEATTTLGNSLGKIIRYYDDNLAIDPPENYKYVVKNIEGAVDILAKALCVYFDEYALRYFDENSSVERADDLLNAAPTTISIHNWLYPVRASLALIAAKLTENSKYLELENIYTTKMQEAVEPYRTDFESIKKLLALLENG